MLMWNPRALTWGPAAAVLLGNSVEMQILRPRPDLNPNLPLPGSAGDSRHSRCPSWHTTVQERRIWGRRVMRSGSQTLKWVAV